MIMNLIIRVPVIITVKKRLESWRWIVSVEKKFPIKPPVASTPPPPQQQPQQQNLQLQLQL